MSPWCCWITTTLPAPVVFLVKSRRSVFSTSNLERSSNRAETPLGDLLICLDHFITQKLVKPGTIRTIESLGVFYRKSKKSHDWFHPSSNHVPENIMQIFYEWLYYQIVTECYFWTFFASLQPSGCSSIAHGHRCNTRVSIVEQQLRSHAFDDFRTISGRQHLGWFNQPSRVEDAKEMSRYVKYLFMTCGCEHAKKAIRLKSPYMTPICVAYEFRRICIGWNEQFHPFERLPLRPLIFSCDQCNPSHPLKDIGEIIGTSYKAACLVAHWQDVDFSSNRSWLPNIWCASFLCFPQDPQTAKHLHRQVLLLHMKFVSLARNSCIWVQQKDSV